MKTYACVTIATIPLRTEPCEKSEIATQLLFGDLVYLIETQGNWSRVHCLFDDYIGWIDNKTLNFIKDIDVIFNTKSSVLDSLFSWAINDVGEKILLPAGATIYNYNSYNLKFNICNTQYALDKPIFEYEANTENVLNLAYQFLNCPYLWGGKTAFGIDCSGLVQVVFKIVGIPLLRDAAQQVHHGKTINFLEEAKPADLIFFDNEQGKITHVGIYIGNNKIIHASGKVRIDDVDYYGIYRKDIYKYTHKLRIIKRIIE